MTVQEIEAAIKGLIATEHSTLVAVEAKLLSDLQAAIGKAIAAQGNQGNPPSGQSTP